MIKRATLSAAEETLVQYIVKLQLDSLRDILNRSIHTDLTMYCLERGITEEKFETEVNKVRRNFKLLQETPESIFSLDDDQISVVKTILVYTKGHRKAKASLWRKLNILEQLGIYYSLN